ncbi:MAG TPA: DUF1329 domain-containing protein [Steroidobacteraceae bacterium]|nr:DUF1329 domain-containing protein [Steroidobacteraceae bacterium]
MRTLMRIAAAGVLLAPLAFGAVTPQEAAQLGEQLTPLGGEKAGNADGSIPAWSGGITSAAAAGFPSYRPSDHHPDPYAADTPLFTITAANRQEYAAQLTQGHKALLETYPDYKMDVYPTHRSAAVPERIAQATQRIATTAELVPGGNGVRGAAGGVPFPIPKSGLEVLWNHLLRFRGVAVARQIGQVALNAGVRYTARQFKEEFFFPCYVPGVKEDDLDNILAYFMRETLAAVRPPGEVLLVQEPLDQRQEERRAWIYNPGQRRVRRAPQIAFDNPAANADNLRTNDQFDMYNGSPQRYDWKLIGKQAMYVPYNSYRLQNAQLKDSDLLHANHINQDYARYELHRVWVVDATLKPGASHLYSRRTFYVDEDSWQILAVDCYDARGRLYRVQEGHVINYYDVPTVWTDLELVMDLSNGAYVALGLQNEEPRSYDFSIKRSAADFQPFVLEQRGVR